MKIERKRREELKKCIKESIRYVASLDRAICDYLGTGDDKADLQELLLSCLDDTNLALRYLGRLYAVSLTIDLEEETKLNSIQP
jgi:hypothetical protein